MTDTFVKEGTDQAAASTTTSFQTADTAAAGNEGIDTKSPEYQLQVVQKRLNDKDEFINTLKEENQETRKLYSAMEERLRNMENISDVLKGQQQDVSNQATNLDENDLVGKVIANLNKKQTQELHEKNYNTVLARLDQEFGSQYIEEKVAAAAQANGLSLDDMVQTARKSPTAFYKLVGVNTADQQRSHTPNPTHGTQTPPAESAEKDFAYYSALMKSNPKEYWKADTQREYRKLFLQPK